VPGIIMTLHTFGEYLDFHPHIHALVADGLFVRGALPPQGSAATTPDKPPPFCPGFLPLPETALQPLEELFRAKVINLLAEEKLLPVDRVQVLYSWKHSGFNGLRKRAHRLKSAAALGWFTGGGCSYAPRFCGPGRGVTACLRRLSAGCGSPCPASVGVRGQTCPGSGQQLPIDAAARIGKAGVMHGGTEDRFSLTRAVFSTIWRAKGKSINNYQLINSTQLNYQLNFKEKNR
jgi:hypothetical protein